jgi:hypothetical protein
MPLVHYTVGYHDAQQHQYEICEYATDSYSAMQHAKEDVPYLREHPHSIDRCTNETGLDYIWNAMSAGIPMGR